MHADTVVIVGPEGTGLASSFPVRTQHEMVDEQLAASGKELRQRLPAFGRVEHIGLGHGFPRQVAPPLAQFIAQLRELLFLGEQRFACCQPLVRRYDRVIRDCLGNDISHGCSSW